MHFSRNRILWIILIVFALFGIGALFSSPFSMNQSGQQAISFLNGHLSLDPQTVIKGQDPAFYKGQWYAPFPPGPALAMLPFIALFGASAPLWMLIVPLAVGTGLLLFRLFQKLRPDDPLSDWLLLGFLFGTGFGLSMLFSIGVWHSAHVLAVFCLVLALSLAFGSARWRGLGIGAALAVAFLSRQVTILTLPFFMILLAEVERPKARNDSLLAVVRATVGQWLMLALPIATAVAFYLWFNEARFGNPFETGYQYIHAGFFIPSRLANYGLWSIHYVPVNFVYFFFQGMHLEFGGTDMLTLAGVDRSGTALLVASPFLIAAFYGRFSTRRVQWAAWATIGGMLVLQLFYHNNGFIQINTQRFSMDFLPILLLLTWLGLPKLPPSLIKGLIVWALLLNIVAGIGGLVGLYTSPI